jgi:hypothetical protein
MAFSVAWSLVGGGVSTMMARSAGSTLVFCLSLFVPIVVNLVAAAIALIDHWEEVAISVAVLPMIALLWAVGLGVMREFHYEGFAWAAIVAGLGSLAFAVRPSHVEAAHPIDESSIPAMPRV